jgi:YD repeat-containing protein
MSGPVSQSYHYNALGLLDLTTASSVSHAFVYDAAGRLVARTTGTGVSESRSYDDDDDETALTRQSEGLSLFACPFKDTIGVGDFTEAHCCVPSS